MQIQRKDISCWATLLAGAAILSFGLFNVHSQSGITEGGVLGTTLLLRRWFGISPGVSEFVIDAVCYALGYRYLGKLFLRRALAASAAFAPPRLIEIKRFCISRLFARLFSALSSSPFCI